MADDFLQLPSDLSNAGKMKRINTRSVDGLTVYEEFTILQDRDNDTQARILTAEPAPSDAGLVVRIAPQRPPASPWSGEAPFTGDDDNPFTPLWSSFY